jgi:UTP:GlnB (protein PII) uridylyltransferase
MEGRLVAGDKVFAASFLREDVPSFFKKYGRSFVESKFEETLKRWQGQSVYRTQPNLKESPGALRDYQLALWIDQASRLSGHLPRLSSRPLVSEEAIARAREGYERLLTFRVALHGLCRRKQDVLDYSMQEAVAQELLYEPAAEGLFPRGDARTPLGWNSHAPLSGRTRGRHAGYRQAAPASARQ